MADEVIKFPLTPENTGFKGGGSLKRNTAGKIGYVKNGPPVLSRYLNTSYRSCHEFCKYGIKHASEAKEISPMLKRITAASDNRNLDKKMFIIRRVSLDSNSLMIKMGVLSSDRKVPISKNDESLQVKGNKVSTRPPNDSKQMHLPTKTSSYKVISNNRPGKLNEARKPKLVQLNDENVPEKILYMIDPDAENKAASTKSSEGKEPRESLSKTPSISSEGKSGKNTRNEINGAQLSSEGKEPRRSLSKTPSIKSSASSECKSVKDTRNEISGAQLSSEGKELRRSLSKSPSFKSSASSECKSVKNSRNEISGAQLSSEGKETRRSLSKTPSIKSSASSEGKSVKNTRNEISGAQLSSEGKEPRRKTPSIKSCASSEGKSVKNTRSRIIGAQLSSEGKEQRRSLSKNPSIKSSASSRSVSVKNTRNRISRAQLPPLLPSSSKKKIPSHPQYGTHRTRLSSSPLPFSTTSSLSGSALTEESGIASLRYKDRLRKGGIANLGYKNHSSHKMHFREGKIIGLHPEDYSPRKLKFRRGKVLSENNGGKNDTFKRNFSRREEVKGSNKVKTEKVVLKHRNLGARKDCQSLFNNVIKETASKLVKTRKSNVKALVGAFETVISLQETKTVAATSTQ